jgi:hypothetical protein
MRGRKIKLKSEDGKMELNSKLRFKEKLELLEMLMNTEQQ